jgi:hypothetical protein
LVILRNRKAVQGLEADAFKKPLSLRERRRRFVSTKEKPRMKVRILVGTITLAILATVGGSYLSTSSAAVSATAAPSELRSTADPAATKFSSRYVSLLNCPSGMTKKEEKQAEERGSDIGSVCKGPGRWQIIVGYSACSAMFTVDRGSDSVMLGTQAVDFKQKNVEFRLANGSAFAVIMRQYEYAGNEYCATAGKITKEVLRVRGLRYFEHIDGEVEVKGNPNANAQARQMADDGFTKGASSTRPNN